jgi:hypothetical protein
VLNWPRCGPFGDQQLQKLSFNAGEMRKSISTALARFPAAVVPDYTAEAH